MEIRNKKLPLFILLALTPFFARTKHRKSRFSGRVPFDQNFWKSRFKIEWNSHFPEIHFENFGSSLEGVLFSGNLEIWKFRKFPVPFGNSTRYESAPVPLAVKSYKMVASLSSRHYTGCKIMCQSSSLFLIAYSPR